VEDSRRGAPASSSEGSVGPQMLVATKHVIRMPRTVQPAQLMAATM
jgi:hypothetical protein